MFCRCGITLLLPRRFFAAIYFFALSYVYDMKRAAFLLSMLTIFDAATTRYQHAMITYHMMILPLITIYMQLLLFSPHARLPSLFTRRGF